MGNRRITPIRGQARILIVSMIICTTAIFILGVFAGVTRSFLLGICVAFIGSAIAVAIGIVVIRAIGRLAVAQDRVSTHIRHLERVTAKLNVKAEDFDEVAVEIRNSSTNQIKSLRGDLQVLRCRVPAGFLAQVESDLTVFGDDVREAFRLAFESAIQLKRDPKRAISDFQATELFEYYLGRNELLQLRPLIDSFDVLEVQNLATLRRLYRYYRGAGYWDLASQALTQAYAKSEKPSDAEALEKIQHEIEVFSHPSLVSTDLPEGAAYDSAGPILHMVGRVLPETQTGYTLRTQYTAMAQARKGLSVAIVGQSGITLEKSEEFRRYSYQGIDYHLLPGPARNELLVDDWLRRNMGHLGELVKELRPSVLHAQSDFFNALIVNMVGRKYGIPIVYESRGFWEESWLSRTITANRWSDSYETLFSMYGRPAAYDLRQHSEEVARQLPDHIFTLAEVMRDYILESAHGSISEDAVTVVPNAVEANNFPVQERDLELAAEIGLPEATITVGYISSIVEYEGIDTLIEAFRLASTTSSEPICLLLVGDGDYMPQLQEQVERAAIGNVFFTGRVPHEDVLRYYGLIDIFVVPRKKSAVSDLVTPLKPFEAFSTGRAVILSDVEALREIADQSNAVESFRAESAVDLSRKLIYLIENPERRRTLSERAARWVRNHRSWDRNVNEYYRVYRKLGYSGPASLLIESELCLNARGVNPGELVEALTGADLPPIEGWYAIENEAQTAQSILEEGWVLPGFNSVPVSHLDDWAQYGAKHRSWGFHLHAWEFMDPLIRSYDETGDCKWLVEALRIAAGWIEIYHGSADVDDPMAWYDMALSLRTPRLLALTLRAARFVNLRDETIILANSLTTHLDELRQDSAFNPRNNHGFYTAVSQVHVSKYGDMLPGIEDTAVEGRKRLARMALSQFAADGVHLEHSPGYHLMVLKSFEAAIKDGLIEDEDVNLRIERAAHVLGWMVQPDGALVQFGDTPRMEVTAPNAESIDPQTHYVLSNGNRGQEPSAELAVFPEGGYAFVRSPRPDSLGSLRESGYLAFSASFHSRVHKHADDLNIVWYDRGQQILTDSGRFGYGDLLPVDSPVRQEGFYYASPERQYVEGTMAHNTLMMDGRNQDRRAREPYGSALNQCAEHEGVFDLSGRVHHSDYIHRRRVIYRPQQELLLKDSVFSTWPEERQAVLWFNVDGNFVLESTGSEVVFSLPERKLLLRVASEGSLIDPVRGQKHPLRGWKSEADQALVPVWSVGFSFRVAERASIDTRLTLEEM